jgi:hypothetical protein
LVLFEGLARDVPVHLGNVFSFAFPRVFDPIKGPSLMEKPFSFVARRPRVVSAIGMAASPTLAAGNRLSFGILLFPTFLAVVLAAALTCVAGTAEAAIVTLAAPFTVTQNYGTKYLNFNGTSLVEADSPGANSVLVQNVYGNLFFNNGVFASNYAINRGDGSFRTFSRGDVISATSDAFSSAYRSEQPSSAAPTLYVVGFFNSQGITSYPGSPENNPNSDFIANSNLAWVEIHNDGGNLRVEAAGVNTVAGGPIAAGETVVVPEPSTYAMALAGLACGGWQMFRRRRAP